MRSLAGHNLGPYRLIEQLDAGGMAVIYTAYDPSLDRYVAIKVLPEYLGNDPEFSERFRREARNVARLRHPNIVPIYSYGEQDGLSYFVMELVEGGTLKRLMGRPMELRQAAHIITQVADALQYAHEQGIVHRDVKPGNVLLPRPDWALLSDFGIARVLEQTAAMTNPGSAFLGTPHYMAPEQARGERVTPRTDQYALGIVLYEMLTGSTPFRADTPQAIVYQHIFSSLPLPRERNPDLPEAIQRVILKALAKEPEDRFPDMTAFAAAVRAATQESAERPMASETQEISRADVQAAQRGPTPPPPAPPTHPVTERIEKPPLAPAVQPVRADRPRRRRLVPSFSPGRRLVWAIGTLAAAILAVAIVLLQVARSGSAGPVPVTIVAAGVGPLPSFSIQDTSSDSTVVSLSSAGGEARSSLKPGHYSLQFPPDSRYRATVPFNVGSGGRVTLRLANLCTLLRFKTAQGNPPDVHVDSADGSFSTDVSSRDARAGVWLLNGRYRVTFQPGTRYLGAINVWLHRQGSGLVNLSERTGFVRVVAAPDMPLQKVEVDNLQGETQFDLPTGDLERRLQWPVGRYQVIFNDKNGYLDPLTVVVRRGEHLVLDLQRRYDRLSLLPPRGASLPNLSVDDARGNWLTSITAVQAQTPMYVTPGSYILDVTGSNQYLDKVPVTLQAGTQTVVNLGHIFGGLRISAPANTPLPNFDIRDPFGSTTIYSVSAANALGTLYIHPGKYALYLSDSHPYLSPVPMTVRSGATTTVNLASILGELMVAPAPGAPISSIDVHGASSGTPPNMSSSDASAGVFLRAGRYTLAISSDSNAYIDPAPVTVAAGKLERLDLGSVYAGLRVPSVPQSASVSYTWRSAGSSETHSVQAGSSAQTVYVLPGTYQMEVSNGGANRLFTVHTAAKQVTRLPIQ